ncbi:hypothetical protein BsWGS_20130 [Bradybaena similaris]
MKSVILFLAVVVAMTFAEEYSLVEREVHAILHANPSISVADCTQKCDDAFELLDPVDEADNDKECADECHCHVTNPNCDAPKQPISKSSTVDSSLLTFVLSAILVISMRFL